MDNDNTTHVNIIDIKMPFWSMVIFMVKASIAAIPAFIILSFFGSVLFMLLGSLFNGMFIGMGHY
ncbi:MAG: hypothetical protein OEW63_00535 [Gammaproteobacteria bacterium]|nr:hypothetical protein [Gammaproteobacteria bacterium]